MIKVRVPSLYQQLNSEAYTKMSKLFSWFKKDKTEQESANPAPQIEAESQTQLEAEQPLVQAPDSEQAASDKPAAQAPVLETMVCETKTVSQTQQIFKNRSCLKLR
jgi:alpha-beta hydrolase superfamily lysophospholipase